MQILLIIGICSKKDGSAVRLNTDSVCHTHTVCLLVCSLSLPFSLLWLKQKMQDLRFSQQCCWGFVFWDVTLLQCVSGSDDLKDHRVTRM